MFDTLVVRPTQYVHTTIKEYRAPTDESVKLLKEFEEKAEKKLIASARLDNNFVKATYHAFKDNLMMETQLVIRAEINGNVVDWRDTIKDYQFKDEEEQVLHIYECLGKMLAKEIIRMSYKRNKI